MPYYLTTQDRFQIWQEKKKRSQEKRRRHADIVRAWKAGKLTWNEYIRLEKKYRT